MSEPVEQVKTKNRAIKNGDNYGFAVHHIGDQSIFEIFVWPQKMRPEIPVGR